MLPVVEPRLGGQSRHVPSSTLIHPFTQWQTRCQTFTMALPPASPIQRLGVGSLRQQWASPGPSLSTRPSHTRRFLPSRRSTRVGSAHLSSLQPFYISIQESHSVSDLFHLHFTGVLPSPSIGSASPAPPVTDLVPGHDFATLNQEASAQNPPSKRFQQAVSQVHHLLERGDIPELYVSFRSCAGDPLTQPEASSRQAQRLLPAPPKLQDHLR